MIERIAFDHIIHKLDSQRNDIQNIRNQAAISAAVTGLVASVFSTLTTDNFLVISFFGEGFLGFTYPAILLILTFGGAIVTAALVLTGYRDFTFSFDAKTMLSEQDDLDTEAKFFCNYIKDGEWFFGDNEKKINEAQNMLWWSIVLGCCQFIPWLLLLRRT